MQQQACRCYACSGKGHRPQPVEERFWRKVVRGPACWQWVGSAGNAGYGLFMRPAGPHGPRGVPAHRMAWQLERGPIPDGMEVAHRCDNRLCVRPDHLFLATHADNMRDMATKGHANSHRSAALRWEVWERDDFRCQRCGVRRWLTLAPVTGGGRAYVREAYIHLDASALLTVCVDCR